MSIVLDFGIILIASITIYITGNWFASASSNLGDYFRLPRSVKGITFDAISSSLPELLVAVFSVIAFKQFEVGIGTIAGSALFNLLVIPGICALVAPSVFRVSKEVIGRDGMFYILSVFALLAALLYSKVWGLGIPILFLIIYLWYVKAMVSHTKRHRESTEKKHLNISLKRELSIALSCVGIIGFATFFLTEHSISFAEHLGIAPIIIGFTIIAAATSIPDTVISVANAKKGDIDDAAANVFGSNIFDICIGLSAPLFLAYFYGGPVKIVFEQLEIILGLLGATIIVLLFMAEDRTLDKREAKILLFMYLVFVAYVVFLSYFGITAG